MAEFGGVVVRQNPELLHGFHRQSSLLLRHGEADHIGHVAAIEVELLVPHASAADAEDRQILATAALTLDDRSRGENDEGRCARLHNGIPSIISRSMSWPVLADCKSRKGAEAVTSVVVCTSPKVRVKSTCSV